MRLFRVISLAASVCLCGLHVGTSAHAQPAGTVPGKEHAKRLFEEGVELEKKGDFAGALAKYKEAEQITVTPGLRFHTGYCLEMTGKLVAALEAYEAADKLARDQNKPDVHAAVTTRLDPLRARVPQLAIRLTTPATGAEVQLDGVIVGAPLLDGKSFRIEPGEHVVTARAAGFKPFTRKVQVPESVDNDRRREPRAHVAGSGASGTAAAPPLDATPDGGRQRASGRGSRAALAGASHRNDGRRRRAGGHRHRALPRRRRRAERRAERLPDEDDAATDRRSKVRTLDALALGGFVGAAGLGVASVDLWTSKAPEHGAASSGAWVVATPSSVGVAGAF